MSDENFGGNIISYFNPADNGETIFSLNRYKYFMHNFLDGESISISNLGSFAVFVLDISKNANLEVNNEILNLKKGDSMQVEDMELKIRLHGPKATCLIAGSEESSPYPSSLNCIKNNDIYKVTKPWGHELWISGDHPSYAFKEIFIKAGTKTSLQYHKIKKETNVLFSGTADLHYKNNESIENDQVTSADIDINRLKDFSIINVDPNNIHRLEAVSDLLLYEVSTPHLDDVIRISDDTNRSDGKIVDEHKKNK